MKVYYTLLLTAIVFFVHIDQSFSQVITNYTFSATSGTFTALTAPTNPTLTSGSTDDGYFNAIPIGFDFFYMGTRYTTVSASTNGWISLGSVITNYEYDNNLVLKGSSRPLIAPLWDDLDIAATTNISYLTTGAAPNRILTIQYLNTKWQYNAAGATIDFQVKLTESSGVINFIYRNQATALAGPSASVGLAATSTGSGNFLSLNKITDNTATVSSTVETNTISVKPTTSGQTYTFTPPTPAAPTALTFSSVASTSMTLNWTDNSTNETGFAIYRSLDNVTFTYYNAAPATTTSANQTGLTGSTTYYWKVYAVTEGKLSTAISGTQATNCAGPAISQVPASGLIARYKLDGNANDEQNINQGFFQNTPVLTTDRFGIANKAYSFNGSNQFMATSIAYNNPSDYTVSVWFNTTTTVGGRIIGFGDSRIGISANHDRMVWMNDDGIISFCVNPGGVGYVISTTDNYNDGSWHQVTATCSSVNGIKLYIDGVLANSNASALGGQNYPGYWKLGWESAGWNPAPSSLFLNASLDDLLIYNRELTSTEVSTIYKNPDGAGSNSPVCNGGTLNLTATAPAGTPTYAWTGPSSFSAGTQNTSVAVMNSAKAGTYTFTVSVSGCATTTTAYVLAKLNNNAGPAISQVPVTGLLSRYKLDGNAQDEQLINPALLQGSPSTTTGRFGMPIKAYSLNGTSQYVSTTVQYVNPSNFTIAMWFKTNTSTGGDLISFGINKTGLSGQHDRAVYMNNAGKIYFGVYTGSVQTINTTASYNDNTWHHVAVSLSSTNGIKLYLDGVLSASNAAVTSAENTTGYWKFGYDDLSAWPSPPTSIFFNGSIDDIFIYNTELSAANVAILNKSVDGAGTNGPVCMGATLTLNATTVASTTYSWTGPNSFSSTSQNPTPTVAYSSLYAGTYTLVATSGGCSITAYALVTDTQTPGLWTGSTNNSWTTTSNWCGGVIPLATTDVTVPFLSTMPTISGTANAKNISISPSATLTNSSTGILNVYGDFTNNGTFTDNSIYTSAGVVNFMGSTAQNITGTTVFRNLTLNNTAGLTLNSTTTVNGILTLTAGILTTNGNLNQNLYNGAIAGTGTGSTTGNIRFFKTIWGDHYHYLSSPITARTAADWNDNVTIKFGATSNLYSYNEALTDSNQKVGWTAITTTATTLADVKGYALFFPRFIYNTLLDVTGPYTHSTTFTSATLTNTPSTTPVAKPSSDGWNLVGNPYPSTLDWTIGAGWTKPGALNNAIYIWNGRTNKYSSYISGAGTNGGSQYIGSMQGFFVNMAAGGSGTLSVNNNARVTSTLLDVWRTEAPSNILRLSASIDTISDETVIRLMDGATENFDGEFDAYKLYSEGNTPTLSSMTVNEEEYSINSLPIALTEKTIPLKLTTALNGSYSISADLSDFTSTSSVFLEDRFLNITQDLNLNPRYTTYLNKGTYKARFFIHYKSIVTDITNITSPSHEIEISAYQQTILILFADQHAEHVAIEVYDATGKKIYALEDSLIQEGQIAFPIPDSSGIYIVKVQTAQSATARQVYLKK